jgi:hypothetical protein
MNAPEKSSHGSGTRGEPVRRPLEAHFVGVLDNRNDGRGLSLIKAHTRVVRRYDIHELILTDEKTAAPGGTVNGVHYIGFVEFDAGGGILAEGDSVNIGGTVIGTIAGFDESHCPNHYNVLIKGPRRITGVELAQQPGYPVIFLPPR